MPLYPIHLEIDLPAPTVNPSQPGWVYNSRFDARDREYEFVRVWRDPARHTVMLKPYQLDPAFKTTTTGLLQRLQLGHFRKPDGSAPTTWEAMDYSVAGDTFLMAKSVNDPLVTLKSWRANQAFFLRGYCYGPYGDRGTWFTFEWGKPSLAGSGQYLLTLSYDGSFTLNKDGGHVFDGYLGPTDRDRITLQQRYVELMILPYNRNEILFWSNQGGYPVYTDFDLDPNAPNGGSYQGQAGYDLIDATGYAITKPGHAKINFPDAKGFFQLTSLAYLCDSAGNGLFNSLTPVKTPYPPDEALFPPGEGEGYTIDGDKNTALGAIAGLSSGLLLDGVDDEMNWSVILHGHRPDPDNFPLQADLSPFCYGFEYRLPNEAKTTDDDTTDITDYIRSLTRTFTEEDCSARIEFKDPYTIDPTGIIYRALNRACRIYVADAIPNQNELFLGYATNPEYDEWAASPDGVTHTPVAFKVGSPWTLFDVVLKNVQNLDGMRADLAVRAILKAVQWPEERVDIDVCNFTLPKDERNGPLTLQQATARAKELLLHIRDAYTSSDTPPYRWIMDFAPVVLPSGAQTICFRFKDPANLPDATAPAAVRTWYASEALAIAAGKTLDACPRDFHRETMEVEATRVAVYGLDGNDRPIIVWDADEAAENPNTPFADRPDNWVGKIVEVEAINPAWNTPALCNTVLLALMNRLTKPRYVATWHGQGEYDERVSDHHKLGNDGERRYVLREIETEHVLEDETLIIRNATYTGEARE